MTRYHIYLNGEYKATSSPKVKSRREALDEYIDFGLRLLLSDKVEIVEDNTVSGEYPVGVKVSLRDTDEA